MHVLLTGGNGMLGRSIRALAPKLRPEWVIDCPRSSEMDLRNQHNVKNWMESHKYDLVIHCAAVVGGIKANMANPVEFLAENLLINTNIIEESRKTNVPRFIFIGSSCMYPRDYKNPLKESYVLEAPLEPTNEGYALSKISGGKHCEYISKQYGLSYKTLVPCNLYGVGDHFDAEKSHLVSAIIMKVHNAMETHQDSVEIWGDGMARREFLYVDDFAKFILSCADYIQDLPPFLNVGLGKDYTVNEYYEAAAKIIGYKGKFTHNLDAPVGMMRKLMDSSHAINNFKWSPSTSIEEGILKTYQYYLSQRKIAA